MKEMTLKAWHFARDDGKLAYGDGRKIVVGKTLKHKGELVMCRSGLHASVNILDALQFARGFLICRVELGGEIIKGYDKAVATERKTLWMVPGEKILLKFARMCAFDVVNKWYAPEIVVRYLKTGDESLRNAAWAATWAASSAAMWAASNVASSAAMWAAAWAATRAAASAAMYSVGVSSAASAASKAAWDARAASGSKGAASRAAQSRRLVRMVREARTR